MTFGAKNQTLRRILCPRMASVTGLGILAMTLCWQFAIVLALRTLATQGECDSAKDTKASILIFLKFEVLVFFAQTFSLILWSARWLMQGDGYFGVGELAEEDEELQQVTESIWKQMEMKEQQDEETDEKDCKKDGKYRITDYKGKFYQLKIIPQKYSNDE